VQDPAYTCVPGSACIRSSICGNKRVEPGENCDDGNTAAADGCGANCNLEQGWVCPAPGSPCMRAARCGDGVVQVTINEVCDDVDDARVFGGIHYRFDQVAGNRLGREIATYVYKHNLRKANGPK